MSDTINKEKMGVSVFWGWKIREKLFIYPINPDSSGLTLNGHNSAQTNFARKRIALSNSKLGVLYRMVPKKIPNSHLQ